MNPQRGITLNSVLLIILILLALFLSGAGIYLGFLSKKDKTTDTTAGINEQREIPPNISKTPSPTPTFKKGEQVISEGTLLKYPTEHQSYSNELYIKKENGSEHLETSLVVEKIEIL